MAFDDQEDDSGYDKPVEEGKTYTVTVEDLGSKGDGIARVEGFVVFVPETEVGETVKVEINSVGRKFAFGEVTERDVEPEEVPDDDGDDEVVDEFDEDEEAEDDRYDREVVDEFDEEVDDERAATEEVEDPFADEL